MSEQVTKTTFTLPGGEEIDVTQAFSGVGHNSDPNVGGIAADRLRSIIERIERLSEEVKAIHGDVKDVYAESKSAGFEPKIIRQLIAIRKREPADVTEEETLLDIYRRALGM